MRPLWQHFNEDTTKGSWRSGGRHKQEVIWNLTYNNVVFKECYPFQLICQKKKGPSFKINIEEVFNHMYLKKILVFLSKLDFV